MMTFEDKRYQLQQVLDASKSQDERNVMGQYSTQFALAKDIVEFAVSLCHTQKIRDVLEPACGMGVFFSALKEVLHEESLDGAVGFELDPHYAMPAAELWKDYGVDIKCADFLSQDVFRRFPLLIANPPYSRHHHIPSEQKKRLQKAVLAHTGLRLSGLSGLYCYFMILSTRWLEEGGLSCWLIPSEFMDVNYGEIVKQYLLENVDLIRIHRFDENDLQFSDALVSSAVVFFRNSRPSNHPIEFTFSGSVCHPSHRQIIDRCQLSKDKKWNRIFVNQVEDDVFCQNVLGDFFEVKRGIATGRNDFFVVNEETIRKYEIPSEYLTPVLPSPRKMKEDRIESKEGKPLVSNPLFLFSTDDDIETIKAKYPGVARYIEKGESDKVNETYICSRHKPWYSCEKRDRAPFIIPYMGRGDNGKRMFRFILNESDAVTTNGYLLMYPKKEFRYLFRNPQLVYDVWRELTTIPIQSFEKQGRFYGGGLHKMEPRELLRLPANNLNRLMGCLLS